MQPAFKAFAPLHHKALSPQPRKALNLNLKDLRKPMQLRAQSYTRNPEHPMPQFRVYGLTDAKHATNSKRKLPELGHFLTHVPLIALPQAPQRPPVALLRAELAVQGLI